MRLPDEPQAVLARRAGLMLRPPPGLLRLVRHRGDLEWHWISAGPVAPGRVVLWFHGGAFVAGSPVIYAAMLGRLARLAGVEVCAPRYPLAQETPFPAAPDTAMAAWEGLLALGYRPGDIVIAGDSAGGGLAAGLLARVLTGGARPAGLLLFSPWADLVLAGDSLAANGPRDPFLPVERIGEIVALYLQGADPADPRASPVLAAYPGAPPALIQAGADEALLSDAVRLAARLRAGGGTVALDLWAGCPHVWQLFDGWLPESRLALRAAARFVQASFASTSR
ncbi:MAG: alpha/beta hydrolase fold domain-containing protein [Rubellimicrobium sp.]|nr:alpha/beta hydrolase fold domain-containing protein [Rubellimicrobium sp.]